MLVEVLLDVEVGKLLTIRDAEEALEVGIRVDLMLVLETSLLDISRDARSNFSAAHLSANGLAKELAEGLRDILGLLEYIGLLGLSRINLTLIATTLAGLLDLLSNTLVELTEIDDHLLSLITETSYSLKRSTDVIRDSSSRSSISSRADRAGLRSSYRGSNLSSLGLSGTRLLLSYRGSSGVSRGSYRSSSRGSIRLLNYTRLLVSCGGHCVITGCIIIHVLTH
jgi:hypothetical protein